MMRNLFALPLLAAPLLATALTASAETCEKPYKVDIPDGAKASKDVLIETQKKVKAYMAEGDAYLACLENEEKNMATAVMSEEAIEEERALRTRRHNAMVDEMHLVGEAFNNEVRAYKAANADS
ncbi:MAG: hypothetical protein AAGB27_12190 [Pseudomonadota bacterium]